MVLSVVLSVAAVLVGGLAGAPPGAGPGPDPGASAPVVLAGLDTDGPAARERENYWAERLLSGDTLVLQLDGCTTIGKIACGGVFYIDYRAEANCSRVVGRHSERGFVSFDSKARGAGYCNASPRDNEISIFGAVMRFDRAGAIYAGRNRVGRFLF